MCESVQGEQSDIKYDLLSEHDKIMLGFVSIDESQLSHVKNQKIGVLKHNLYLSLQKTDYVHTSEFLDSSEKQLLLEQRRLLRDKYDRIKSDLQEASTIKDVQSFILSL